MAEAWLHTGDSAAVEWAIRHRQYRRRAMPWMPVARERRNDAMALLAEAAKHIEHWMGDDLDEGIHTLRGAILALMGVTTIDRRGHR